MTNLVLVLIMTHSKVKDHMSTPVLPQIVKAQVTNCTIPMLASTVSFTDSPVAFHLQIIHIGLLDMFPVAQF